MKTNELHYLTQQRLPFVQVQKSEIWKTLQELKLLGCQQDTSWKYSIPTHVMNHSQNTGATLKLFHVQNY
jgi:hypothetical protein